jgi:hypothetical protein
LALGPLVSELVSMLFNNCLIVAGDVFLGTNIFTRQEVAVKLEIIRTRGSELEAEYDIYKRLKGCCSVPNVHWFGAESDYNALVVDLLGPSLEDLLNQHGRNLSLKTVIILAGQLVSSTVLPRIRRLYLYFPDIQFAIHPSPRNHTPRYQT